MISTVQDKHVLPRVIAVQIESTVTLSADATGRAAPFVSLYQTFKSAPSLL
jgi:hypothetical protein